MEVSIKRFSFAAALILFTAAGAFSQDSGFNFPELSGYKKITNYPVYNPDNLWDFINGAAEGYLSYGFEELHVAEYRKGRNSIKLEIYRHKDNIQAFGIYSSERSPSFRFINIGAQGYRTGSSLNFLKGRYYVKIRTHSSSAKVIQMLETLALRTADMLPGETSMPAALGDFPPGGKKADEEIYIKEGVLGHEFLTGAFRASYSTGDVEFSVFLLDRRDSSDAHALVNAYLKAAGLDSDESSEGKYMFRDGYNGTIFLAWKESRVVIIQGLEKDQSDIADRYTSEILN